MSGRHLQPEPLTREDFAPYGDVIETAGARHFPINQGFIERYHDLARLDIDTEAGGRPAISIMACNRVTTLPCEVTVVERHPHGSQAFVPMNPARMIIVVAVVGDDPRPEDFRAFVSDGMQGVNYHAAVWHMPLICEQADNRFLIVDRVGPGHNCDEVGFEPGRLVVDA